MKIFFWSDGDYSAILDDVVSCGADGFGIEPMMDLGKIVKKYAGKKFIVGNVNTQILTFKGEAEIDQEVRWCLSVARDTPGYFICASGSLPYNMPVQNACTYLSLVDKYRQQTRDAS